MALFPPTGLFPPLRRRRSVEQRRLSALRQAPAGPLREYLQLPLPGPTTPVQDLRLLAIDLETTGLDPDHDHLLAIGFVPVDGTTIRLAGARRLLVRPRAGVGESATIHGITDDEAHSGGISLEEALAITLQALQGRALLAHFAHMETGFLDRACLEAFGASPVFTTVDTLQIQYRLMTVGHADEPPRSALRLWRARARYGLPTYRAHEALTDALACAELYLALVAEPGTGSTLRDLQR